MSKLILGLGLTIVATFSTVASAESYVARQEVEADIV